MRVDRREILRVDRQRRPSRERRRPRHPARQRPRLLATNSGASSARLYWESYTAVDMTEISVPTDASIFPQEIIRPSRRWAAKRFTDIRYWNELERGGHFAAFKQPARRPGGTGCFPHLPVGPACTSGMRPGGIPAPRSSSRCTGSRANGLAGRSRAYESADSAGTQIVTDDGCTLIRSFLAGFLSPPSSSYLTGRSNLTLNRLPPVSRTKGDLGVLPAAMRAKTRVHCSGRWRLPLPAQAGRHRIERRERPRPRPESSRYCRPGRTRPFLRETAPRQL